MSPNEAKDVLWPAGRPPTRAMRSVLVCLDRSPAAEEGLPVAVALARAYGSELVLLHVLEGGSPAPETAPPDAVGWLIHRTEAEEYLAGVVARLERQGVRARSAVIEGHVAEQILCFADREGVDLILLSSHGEKGVTEWSLGSTTEKVLARARTSVLIVPVERSREHLDGEPRLERVLVLLDGSPRAETVLPVLERLARERSAVLILLHVAVPPQLFETRSPAAAEDARIRSELEARNERRARDYLARTRSRLTRGGCAVHEILERGDVRALLSDVAAREGIDLIAITSHGRTGDRSRGYGDTAAHLLRSARVPVLMLQCLPQRTSEFAEAVRHRRDAAPLRGSGPLQSP